MAREKDAKHRDHPIQVRSSLDALEINVMQELSKASSAFENKWERQNGDLMAPSEVLETMLREEVRLASGPVGSLCERSDSVVNQTNASVTRYTFFFFCFLNL